MRAFPPRLSVMTMCLEAQQAEGICHHGTMDMSIEEACGGRACEPEGLPEPPGRGLLAQVLGQGGVPQAAPQPMGCQRANGQADCRQSKVYVPAHK